MFPSLYQMVPKEEYQYKGIIQLLLHFQWTWIGLFAADDDSGDRFLQTMVPMLSQNSICDAFILRTPKKTSLSDFLDLAILLQEKYPILVEKKANVFFVYGEPPSMIVLRVFLFTFNALSLPPLGKVWIVTAHWDFTTESMQRDWDVQSFHGALSFTIHSSDPPGFQKFVQTVKPSWAKTDTFIHVFWEQAFDCLISMTEGKDSKQTCTGAEKLESLPQTLFEMSMTGHSYNVYSAVHAVAHALHAMHESTLWLKLQSIEPWQVILNQRHSSIVSNRSLSLALYLALV